MIEVTFVYDYVSIHSKDYTKKIESMILEQYVTCNLGFKKISQVTFFKEINFVENCTTVE